MHRDGSYFIKMAWWMIDEKEKEREREERNYTLTNHHSCNDNNRISRN